MTKKHRRRIQMVELEEQKKARRAAQAVLREKQAREGFCNIKSPTPDNSKCPYKTEAEEIEARKETARDYLKVMQKTLPNILERLSKVKDYRDAKKVKHKVAVILLFGIFWFILHKTSRRQANEELTNTTFMENMKMFFPDIESLPHHDTVSRFLSNIDINELEDILAGLIRSLLRRKVFQKYLINKCVTIAIDGTQKHTHDFLWSEECLEQKTDEKTRYYCYAIEASLVFHNGIVIPLATEFADFMKGDEAKNKQDCEINAFKRLARKIKAMLPRSNIMLLIDGLYASGPIMEICRKNKWQFMIVFKDSCLRSVWEEYNTLVNFDDNKNNHLSRKWGNRRQKFSWVNDICYMYEGIRKEEILHVVVCEEEWEEVDERGETVNKYKKFAWLSSEPLTRCNVHHRCNLGARYRWGIENGGFLVEKRYGYQYEHTFSFNWNAMKGFHILMRIGHLINVLAQYSELLKHLWDKKGDRAFIKFLDETLRFIKLDIELIKESLSKRYQIRFV